MFLFLPGLRRFPGFDSLGIGAHTALVTGSHVTPPKIVPGEFPTRPTSPSSSQVPICQTTCPSSRHHSTPPHNPHSPPLAHCRLVRLAKQVGLEAELDGRDSMPGLALSNSVAASKRVEGLRLRCAGRHPPTPRSKSSTTCAPLTTASCAAGSKPG
jgi:hypothetical protein